MEVLNTTNNFDLVKDWISGVNYRVYFRESNMNAWSHIGYDISEIVDTKYPITELTLNDHYVTFVNCSKIIKLEKFVPDSDRWGNKLAVISHDIDVMLNPGFYVVSYVDDYYQDFRIINHIENHIDHDVDPIRFLNWLILLGVVDTLTEQYWSDCHICRLTWYISPIPPRSASWKLLAKAYKETI